MKLKILLYFIYFISLFIKLTCQNIIGFYQTYISSTNTYTWNKCNNKCYTCLLGTVSSNQNCLSCDENKGNYFYEADTNSNCYSESEFKISSYASGKAYFLDTNQNPPKWALCHEKCNSCSKKETYDLNDNTKIIQMNCDTCKSGFIKVNTFCYQKVDPPDNILSFIKDGISTNCGQLLDDNTGKQLGIKENGNECFIKPENTYFENGLSSNLLKDCEDNCGSCIYDSSRASNNLCLKCINNFIINMDTNNCECPKYLGKEDETNNCVNCKYSPSGPYNHNGVCKSSKIIDNINYHIVNTSYNIISNCKRPCLECDLNGRCITCQTNYYLDKVNLQNAQITDNNKICLTYNECLNIGFPIPDFNICYNCKEHNVNSYRIPNINYCSAAPSTLSNDYYLINEDYNALVKCHERCDGCSGPPKGEKQQKCIACKGGYEYNSTTNNCEIKVEEKPKCPNLLFYVDESETEIDEKKKCLSPGDLCPEDYPFLVQRDNLCVQKCPENLFFTWTNDVPIVTFLEPENKDDIYKNIIDNLCVHFSKKNNYINDFWNYFDEKIKLQRNNIFNYFNNYVNSFGRNLEEYNNMNSLYIFGEDATFHITKLFVENNYIYSTNSKNNNFRYNSNSNYFNNYYKFSDHWMYSSYRNERRISIIFFSECEKLLKRLNNIGDSNNLLLLKLDIYRNDTQDEILTNKVQYKLYNSYNLNLDYDLDICENYPINIITPTYINLEKEENIKLMKMLRNVIKEGYEPFILYTKFYYETCEQFSNEDGIDMTLKDRRKYIYEKIKKFKFCEKNCYYQSSDENINFINCICKAKIFEEVESDYESTDFNTLEEENENNYFSEKISKKLEDIKKNKINDYFNIYLGKCIRLLFSEEGFYYNYGSMIIIALFILYILFMLFYFCIGFDIYINQLKKFLFLKYLGRDKITKIYYYRKKTEEVNSSLEEKDLKENDKNIFNNIQTRTNSDNIYNRHYNFRVHDANRWIRENKSSILADPMKDDQIKVVNDYKYKSNELYKNKTNIIRDYEIENNINNNINNNDNDIINDNPNPPKRKNNKYFSMEANNDLINARTVKPITNTNYDYIQAQLDGKILSQKIDNDSISI